MDRAFNVDISDISIVFSVLLFKKIRVLNFFQKKNPEKRRLLEYT